MIPGAKHRSEYGTRRCGISYEDETKGVASI